MVSVQPRGMNAASYAASLDDGPMLSLFRDEDAPLSNSKKKPDPPPVASKKPAPKAIDPETGLSTGLPMTEEQRAESKRVLEATVAAIRNKNGNKSKSKSKAKGKRAAADEKSSDEEDAKSVKRPKPNGSTGGSKRSSSSSSASKKKKPSGGSTSKAAANGTGKSKSPTRTPAVTSAKPIVATPAASSEPDVAPGAIHSLTPEQIKERAKQPSKNIPKMRFKQTASRLRELVREWLLKPTFPDLYSATATEDQTSNGEFVVTCEDLMENPGKYAGLAKEGTAVYQQLATMKLAKEAALKAEAKQPAVVDPKSIPHPTTAKFEETPIQKEFLEYIKSARIKEDNPAFESLMKPCRFEMMLKNNHIITTQDIHELRQIVTAKASAELRISVAEDADIPGIIVFELK